MSCFESSVAGQRWTGSMSVCTTCYRRVEPGAGVCRSRRLQGVTGELPEPASDRSHRPGNRRCGPASARVLADRASREGGGRAITDFIAGLRMPGNRRRRYGGAVTGRAGSSRSRCSTPHFHPLLSSPGDGARAGSRRDAHAHREPASAGSPRRLRRLRGSGRLRPRGAFVPTVDGARSRVIGRAGARRRGRRASPRRRLGVASARRARRGGGVVVDHRRARVRKDRRCAGVDQLQALPVHDLREVVRITRACRIPRRV